MVFVGENNICSTPSGVKHNLRDEHIIFLFRVFGVLLEYLASWEKSREGRDFVRSQILQKSSGF